VQEKSKKSKPKIIHHCLSPKRRGKCGKTVGHRREVGKLQRVKEVKKNR